jgi:hypothetical protein
MGINTLNPDGPDITLLTEKVVVDYVEINQAPAKHTHYQEKDTHDGAKTPGCQPGRQKLPPCCLLSLIGHVDHPESLLFSLITGW